MQHLFNFTSIMIVPWNLSGNGLCLGQRRPLSSLSRCWMDGGRSLGLSVLGLLGQFLNSIWKSKPKLCGPEGLFWNNLDEWGSYDPDRRNSTHLLSSLIWAKAHGYHHQHEQSCLHAKGACNVIDGWDGFDFAWICCTKSNGKQQVGKQQVHAARTLVMKVLPGFYAVQQHHWPGKRTFFFSNDYHCVMAIPQNDSLATWILRQNGTN